MYLKSLVLKGFKSFADRSALTLEPGITAVVGPNGSGKSNISDAVLWVLGERNAKNLRGQAMEDVIFAGSSARKASGLAEVDLVLDNSDGTLPVDFDEVAITRRMYRNGESEYLIGSSARKASGLAEVDLVLDNSDGTLPVDFDEVAITRRMYRNGESEYLINGTVARRMDVLDILHDSGLGAGTHSIISQGSLDSILQSKPEDRRALINGTVARRMDVLDILHDSGLGAGTHSIISQGSLDSILQSKPEDRRALIEEAAGVLKHKQRKAKSERKLANMDQHLLRARDVVGEVARQLGPLERKAKKARTYQELAAQQAEMSLTIAVDDLRGLQKEWDAAKAREAALAAELVERRGAIQEAEAAVEALQERIRQQTLDAGDLSRRHRAAATAVERFDSAAMMLRERRRAAMARAGELELSIEANAVKADEAASELKRATAQYEEAAGELDAAKKKVSDLDAVYRDLGVRRGALERELSALSKDAEKMTAERETARRRHAENTEALSHGLAHVQVVEGRAAELALELARAQEEAERAAAGAAEADGELSALVADEACPRAGGGGARRRAGARARARPRGGRARGGRGRRGRWRAFRAGGGRGGSARCRGHRRAVPRRGPRGHGRGPRRPSGAFGGDRHLGGDGALKRAFRRRGPGVARGARRRGAGALRAALPRHPGARPGRGSWSTSTRCWGSASRSPTSSRPRPASSLWWNRFWAGMWPRCSWKTRAR